jgi:type I restriction enzyme S subunit
VLNNQQAWRGSVGVSKYRGIVSPAYLVFKLSQSLNPEFANYQFRDKRFVDQMMLSSQGVGDIQRQIKWPLLRKAKVFVPPPDEQLSIVAHLNRATSRIDALIARKTLFIELLREKRRALITHTVTKGIDGGVPMKNSGVAWLGRVPAHWGVVQSRRIFIERNQKTRDGDIQLTVSQKYGLIPQAQFVELEGRRVVVVQKGQDILKRVHVGDFVISMRSFQGGLEYSEHEGAVSSAYVPLTPIKWVVPRYFRWLFKCSTYIQALQSTSDLVRDGQALRFEHFSKVPLPVVPEAEQAAIAEYLDRSTSRIDTLITKTERSIELLREHRTALITEAVTGRVDLRKAT